MIVYIVLLFQILLLLSGQMLWKVGMGKLPDFNLSNFHIIIFSPWIIGGGVLFFIATLLWLWILQKGQFSVVYPLQSLSYVLGIFFAVFMFHENVPMTRWSGAALIIIGAILIAK